MNSSSIIATIKKYPTGFACGAICLVAAVLIYFTTSTIDEKQAEYEAKAAEAARILANVRNSNGLPEQVAEIQALTKEMDSRLVRAGQLAVNLQYFYKLEAENEVKLGDVRQNGLPATRATKNLYLGVPYNVSVTGGYKQVMAFLYRLEAGRHFCRFNTVSIAKSPGGIPADAMSLSLSIELLGTP
jgi:Tfp pilus assembly protein PilO